MEKNDKKEAFFLVDRVPNRNILCFNMFKRKKILAEDELQNSSILVTNCLFLFSET